MPSIKDYTNEIVFTENGIYNKFYVGLRKKDVEPQNIDFFNSVDKDGNEVLSLEEILQKELTNKIEMNKDMKKIGNFISIIHSIIFGGIVLASRTKNKKAILGMMCIPIIPQIVNLFDSKSLRDARKELEQYKQDKQVQQEDMQYKQ